MILTLMKKMQDPTYSLKEYITSRATCIELVAEKESMVENCSSENEDVVKGNEKIEAGTLGSIEQSSANNQPMAVEEFKVNRQAKINKMYTRRRIRESRS